MPTDPFTSIRESSGALRSRDGSASRSHEQSRTPRSVSDLVRAERARRNTRRVRHGKRPGTVLARSSWPLGHGNDRRCPKSGAARCLDDSWRCGDRGASTCRAHRSVGLGGDRTYAAEWRPAVLRYRRREDDTDGEPRPRGDERSPSCFKVRLRAARDLSQCLGHAVLRAVRFGGGSKSVIEGNRGCDSACSADAIRRSSHANS